MHTPVYPSPSIRISTGNNKRTFLPKQSGSFQLKTINTKNDLGGLNGPQSIWHYKIRGISPGLQKHSVLQKACMKLCQQQSSVTAWCEMDSEPFEPNKTILMTFNMLQFKIKKTENLLHACHVYSFSNSRSFVCRAEGCIREEGLEY